MPAWLAGSAEAADFREATGMIVDGAIDVVTIEGKDDRSVSCGGGERVEVVLPVAFVNGLTQRNPGDRDDLRIDRCFHEDRSAGAV